ncbi:peptidoglycan D,D-transpeptidase FtsI family protein [Rubrobacter indicoceani]|uniref:peptidoglycan D,D-transpeptidase FtsI family protein n=1 Tax=Rubrobacter indicoceani TaxID=2051957 RepID=UPI0013C495D4|nr:penicillin-binding protein 2 [Rubrobacter indicoceani]
MNRHLRRTFYLFALGFVALVAVLAYWQVYARESLANNPENSLQTRRALEAPRGTIFAANGETVLARSEEQPSETGGNSTYSRVYPEGPLYAGIVGYWSTRYGATGIEIAENANLSGTADPSTLDELINQVSGGPQPGNNVTLTINDELQRAAYNAVASSETGRGSIVAMDPQTGEILALVSYPSYDPNNIDEVFDELINDPAEPLLNRATQGLYPPGSVFKVVTAAAALKDGVRPTDMFTDTGVFERPGYTVVNYDDGVYGAVNFARALELSINTIFAQVTVDEIGAELLYETAGDFGYGSSYEDFVLPVTPSQLGQGDIAQLAFGQDSNVSNVFEMAQVAATIANGGTAMEPHLIREVRSPDGVIIDRTQPQVREEVLDEQLADTLQDMMVGVVDEGSANLAQRSVEIAGKTGTAETPSGDPHSWFIASAPADEPQIAVAAMIENGGDGEAAGLPAAMAVIDTYLDLDGNAQPQMEDQLQQDLPTDPQGIPQGLEENFPQQLPQDLPPEIQQSFEQFFQQGGAG